jgi:phosphomannomutase
VTLNVSSFKAYDIRGRVPDELNEEIAYAIARAYCEFLNPSRVVVGHDIRLSSPAITDALVEGLRDSGVDVSHIGTCGTEEIYFATDHYGFDGGIVVTASHNPKDYNGMKMVQKSSRPISGDTGLNDIKEKVAANQFATPGRRGELHQLDHREAYIEKLLSYVDVDALKPLKVVANAGNGAAGLAMRLVCEKLPIEVVEVQFEPDGNFPHGVPNPLLPENRLPTVDAIEASGADMGIAWDGDFDRCFLFDENGRFIEGYYIVGLLAQAFLEKSPGSAIVHDPRLVWNTTEVVDTYGGRAVMSKAGHAFIKEKMREEDAVYGGEMSAHHYFRDFAYCDSGMIPWLLAINLISESGKPLSTLVDERMSLFPVSGEINRRIKNAPEVIAAIEAEYTPAAISLDKTDGISMDFGDWRFNVRSSNTEPVVRLNVESRGSESLMVQKTEELLEKMGGEPA